MVEGGGPERTAGVGCRWTGVVAVGVGVDGRKAAEAGCTDRMSDTGGGVLL